MMVVVVVVVVVAYGLAVMALGLAQAVVQT